MLEPSFGGAGPDAFLTFVGFLTDGTAAPASAPRARRIELIGDSISAGYGSRGSAALAKNFGCPVNDNTSGNYWTYNWAIAEHFLADIIPIAWSGKGMYVNCCDNGESECPRPNPNPTLTPRPRTPQTHPNRNPTPPAHPNSDAVLLPPDARRHGLHDGLGLLAVHAGHAPHQPR